MYNKCLFYYIDSDGDFSNGFVLDVPLGIDTYPELIKYHSEFFKSEQFKEYVRKEFHAIDFKIIVEKREVLVHCTSKSGNHSIYLSPRFVTSFDKEI